MYVGSKNHDLVGESLIILHESFPLTGSKTLKAGGAKVDASVEEPEVENVSRILLVLSQKNKANMSAGLSSDL